MFMVWAIISLRKNSCDFNRIFPSAKYEQCAIGKDDQLLRNFVNNMERMGLDNPSNVVKTMRVKQMDENLAFNKRVVGIDIVLETCQGIHFSIDDFQHISIHGIQTNLTKGNEFCDLESYFYASGGVRLCIKKEANDTEKLFFSVKGIRPPFDHLLSTPNITWLHLIHDDKNMTRIAVPYEPAIGTSSWDEASIMQSTRMMEDGNLFIRIYGDADIEERRLANEEEIRKRKPRHDEKYYMNSKIKFTDLQAPRTEMELLWMTERYFSEYGAHLYRDRTLNDPHPKDRKLDPNSPETDFNNATGYFNYAREIFNIETVGELIRGENLT